MSSNPDKTELLYLISTVARQRDVIKSIRITPETAETMKHVFLALSADVDSIEEKERISKLFDTPEGIEEIHNEYIRMLSKEVAEKYFDPEDDVAVRYLRKIDASDELINTAKSRVTKDNIKYA